MSDKNQSWDFTEFQRSSKKSKIVKCPVCGQYGQITVYYDPNPKSQGMVKHKGHVEMGLFNMIDESCNLTRDQVEQLGYKVPVDRRFRTKEK